MKKLVLSISLFLVYSISVVGQSGVRTGTSEEWRYPKEELEELEELGSITIIDIECEVPIDTLPTIRWNRVDGATHYQYISSKIFGGEDIITQDTFIQFNGYTDQRYRSGGQFIVRALLLDNNDEILSEGPFTDTCVVFIQPRPRDVISPECGSINISLKDSLKVDDADLGETSVHGYYIFELSETSTFEESTTERRAVFKEGEIGLVPISFLRASISLNDFQGVLKENTKYYWRAKYEQQDPEWIIYYPVDWSETCSFTTGIFGSVNNTYLTDLGFIISNGTLYLKNIHPEASLQLHDISGRVLSSHTGNTLDVSGMSRGTYFIVIDGKKVVKVQL
ncbi:MAG: hypothetical protein Kapaf2KO_18520 [Candidatus Kapaibacteriales bacterium]